MANFLESSFCVHSNIENLTDPSLQKLQNHFNILHLNIRSLNKNHQSLLELLTASKIEFHLIVLSEIWNINIDHFEHLIAGYRFVYSINPASHIGGIGVFVNLSLKFQHEIRHDLPGSEAISLKICLMKQLYTFHCIYHHPNAHVNDFISSLNCLNTRNSFIIGDININLLDQLNPTVLKYTSTLTELGYYPTILLPTRPISSTLIDHIFTNMTTLKRKITSGNILTDITDHFPNFACIPISLPQPPVKTRPLKRIFNDTSTKNFVQKIDNLDFDEFTNYPSEKSFNQFLSLLNNTFNECFPLKMVSIKNHKHKPWITQPLLLLIKEKNQLFKTYLKLKTSISLIEYKAHKKLVHKLLKSEENKYYLHRLASNSQNTKKTWAILKSLLNRTSPQSCNLNLIDNSHNIVSDPQLVVSYFNSFFSDISSHLPPLPILQHSMSLPHPIINPHSFFLEATTASEICTLLNLLKNSFSPGGHDVIPPTILKKVSHAISFPLSTFINSFISLGLFPTILKHAKIIPVFKKGDKENISNYRPISLLSSFSKVFERVLHNRLLSFIDAYGLLEDSQYGFVRKRSTSDALLNVVTFIQQQLNNSKMCIALLIDLRKAFDTVDHKILIHKLHNLGIRGLPLTLFISYLTDRSQSTWYNGFSSSSLPILSGVPQGSILGPLLYILYVNDFAYSIPSKTVLFADDTSFLITGTNHSELMQSYHHCRGSLEAWLLINKLYINLDKTCYLFFGKEPTSPLNIQIYGTDICRCTSSALLGITIDSKFSWKSHIAKLLSKLLPLKSIFYQIRDKLTLQSKYLLYFSMVQSRLNYCIEFYGSASKSVLHPVLITQNKLLKILFHLHPRHSTSEIYRQLNILSFSCLYLKKLLSIAHKAIHLNVIHFPKELLVISSSSRQNSHCILFHSSLQPKDILFNILKNWNSVDSVVRGSLSQ
jgi:hypothetical protein